MKSGKVWILISLSALAACRTPQMSSEVQAAKLAADEARSEAIEVKAPIAAEAEFNSAQAFYDKALEDSNAGSEADVIANYGKATSGFLEAVEIALESRMEAEDAIIEADRAIERSERIVEDAISSVTGGQ